MDRFKTEQCKAIEEATRAEYEQQQLTRTRMHQNQVQKLQNEVFTLETRLTQVRTTLHTEREAWEKEREELRHQLLEAQQELDQVPPPNTIDYTAEITRVRDELETKLQKQQEENAIMEQRLRADLSQQRLDHEKQRATLIEKHTQILTTLQEQLATATTRETELIQQLEKLRLRDPPRKLNQRPPFPTLQSSPALLSLDQDHMTTLARLHDIQAHNLQLEKENSTIQDTVAKLRAQIQELQQQPTSVFATHIDLKRENFQLRTQVEELKQLQRRYLMTTGKKKTMSFPLL